VKAKDGNIRMIPFKEIILIQSSPKRGILELHQEHDLIEFCGMISRIARGIPELFQSHTSVVVNLEHIKSIDEANRKIELTNGRIVPIAVRKTKGLLDLMATMS